MTSLALVLAIATTVPSPAAAPGDALPPPGARSPGQARTALEPDENAVTRLSPALRAQLAADPYVYFRFINVPWMHAVCEQFADAIPGLPPVRLHGDPHLEQYAFTDGSRGLDDFDDSASGPYIVDVVRFLASIDLALRQRGWDRFRTQAMDAFFAGYRASLDDADYLPPDPAIVARMRAMPPRGVGEFLAWADSLMRPLDPAYEIALPAARAMIDEYARQARPGLPPGYCDVKKAGALNMGVGSALASKVLLRLEGPSQADEDDVIVEAKRAGDLAGVPCLTVTSTSALRVVSGAEQIGRLQHEILMVLPTRGSQAGTWWMRSWDRNYKEIDISDYASATELIEVAHDVGAQLGRGHVWQPGARTPNGARRAARRALDRLEARVRRVVAEQTVQLLDAWGRFRRGPVP